MVGVGVLGVGVGWGGIMWVGWRHRAIIITYIVDVIYIYIPGP